MPRSVPLGPSQILALQRSVGNKAIGKLVQATPRRVLTSGATDSVRQAIALAVPRERPSHSLGLLARQDADAGADTGSAPSGGMTTPKFRTVKVWIHAFIPLNVPGVTTPRPNHQGETIVPGMGVLGWVAGGPDATTNECYSGDSRDFSSFIHASHRMHSEVEISDLDKGPHITLEWHDCGTSHGIDCSTGDEIESAKAPSDGMSFSNLRGNATADPIAGVNIDPNPNLVQIDYDGAAAMPLLPSPDIDMNFTFQIDPVGGTVRFFGKVDEFPAYEIYAAVDNGPPQTMLQLMPLPGKTPGNLPGDADRPVSGSVSF